MSMDGIQYLKRKVHELELEKHEFGTEGGVEYPTYGSEDSQKYKIEKIDLVVDELREELYKLTKDVKVSYMPNDTIQKEHLGSKEMLVGVTVQCKKCNAPDYLESPRLFTHSTRDSTVASSEADMYNCWKCKEEGTCVILYQDIVDIEE